ncbi:MAG: hypothetical protein IPG56_09925 [Caulobacteraceae bacterium]|nr:hypothetical protein [Caulobacteraceae bacterium]
MRQTRTLLLVLLALLAILGAGLIVLTNIGDASVVASTGGVYGALETAGAQENVSLRDDLYEIVLRLKGPWAAVQLTGVSVLLLALVGLIAVWRRPK